LYKNEINPQKNPTLSWVKGDVFIADGISLKLKFQYLILLWQLALPSYLNPTYNISKPYQFLKTLFFSENGRA
jgi:hypothetical protein